MPTLPTAVRYYQLSPDKAARLSRRCSYVDPEGRVSVGSVSVRILDGLDLPFSSGLLYDRRALGECPWRKLRFNSSNVGDKPTFTPELRALEQLDETVAECIGAAAEDGISADDLEKAAGGSLKEYLRTAIINTSE